MESKHVLIVSNRPDQAERLQGALVQSGWTVGICPGPKVSPCPLMSGRECTPRQDATASIVFVNTRAPVSASVPFVRCASSSTPSVVVMEGRVDPPRFEAGFAVVGGLRSPDVIAAALNSLVSGG